MLRPNLGRFFKRMTLRRSLDSKSGTTAIEFALIAPLFFMFLIGITELSLVLLTQHLLENATYNASRLAKTSYTETGKTQLDTVINALDNELGSLSPLVDVSKLSFSSMSYGSLSEIGVTGKGTEGLGTAQQVVVFTISYPWTFFTPMIGDLIGDSNHMMTLTSRIVVRNEPYDTGG